MNFFTSSKAVWDYVETFKHQSQRPLVNGFVLQMYVDLSKNASKTVQKLNELFNVSDNSSTRISVAHIYKHVFNLKKNLTVNNSAKLVEFINSRFIADCPQKESKKCTTIPSSSSSSVDLVAVTVVDNINNNNNNNTSTSSSVETRAVCAQCSQLKKTYAKQSAVLKKKCRLAKQEWKNVARLYGVRRINQCKKRVASTIKDLREKCAQLRKENRSLRVQVGGSKSVIKCENKCLKRKLSSMEGIVDEKARVAKTLRKEVCALRCELECSEMEVIQEEAKLEEEKRCRIFSDPLRKCVYYCLMFNVPIEATSKVIQYLGACLGSDVKYVPHPSTVARCAYELGVLCDVQTAEFMLQAESLTLAWDATTLKGDHINQVIITSESGVMVLTTDVLAGGTGDDYAEHLVNSICHIAAVHSRFQCSDYTAVLNSIVRKFRCTMTDRASVNHCAAVRLMNQLQISLLELNCQLHPLECFASATREALLTHEKAAGSTRSKTFGQTAGAVNVIAAISKLRYKDGKGDPTGFKSFLKAEGIDGRLLIRYVGNRLHAVFHLGASIFFLKEKLLTYLKRCSQQALRLAVIADLTDNLILTHLQVLGLFGKVVTGPWMAVIYSSATDRDHMEKTQKVLQCVDFVEAISKSPELLMTTTTDGFGRELPYDEVLASLRAAPASQHFKEAVTLVASRVHLKLEKQLKKYREDPAYLTTSKEIQAQTASASVHNMVCERGLGMIDCLYRRAPNAAMKTLDAKVRARLNHTMDWLDTVDRQHQHALLANARKEGATSRRKALEEKQLLERKILQRQHQKGQEREMMTRRQKEKEVLSAMNNDDISGMMDGVSEQCATFIEDLLEGRKGTMFRHVWSTKDGTDVFYFARLGKSKLEKAKGVKKVWVSYWQDGEADAVDYLMTVHSIVTDALLGDVLFY